MQQKSLVASIKQLFHPTNVPNGLVEAIVTMILDSSKITAVRFQPQVFEFSLKFRDVWRWWNQNLSALSKLRTFRICEKKSCQILPGVTCHPNLSVQATLLMESSYFHAWHEREVKGFKFNAPCSRCAKNESMSNSFGWTPGTVAMTTHGFPQSMPGVTPRLDPLEPGKMRQNSVKSMNRSWMKEWIGVRIMGVKIYKSLTHWFQYMLHVW